MTIGMFVTLQLLILLLGFGEVLLLGRYFYWGGTST